MEENCGAGQGLNWAVQQRRPREKEYYKQDDRMSSDRIPKMILKYQQKGKRNLGRPLKRWKDSVL
jgi:hypothetical protein